MKIFELYISPLSYSEVIGTVTQLKEQKIVFTPNPEICLRTLKDAEFLGYLQRADILTSDGIGLYIGYQIQDNSYGKIGNILLLPYFFFNLMFRRRMLYKKYGERICGSDLTMDITGYASTHNIKITIIDLYNPSDEKKVANQKVFGPKLQEYFPELQFDYHIYSPEDKQDILEHIKNSDTQILFSTLGMKAQEESVIEIMAHCPNIKLGLGVGSSFDYITGFQRRAPKTMRQIGFEWLYRIFTSPGKIKRICRVFQAVVIFPLKVINFKK